MTAIRKVRLGRWYAIVATEAYRGEAPGEWKFGVALYGSGYGYARLVVDVWRFHGVVHVGVFR